MRNEVRGTRYEVNTLPTYYNGGGGLRKEGRKKASRQAGRKRDEMGMIGYQQ